MDIIDWPVCHWRRGKTLKGIDPITGSAPIVRTCVSPLVGRETPLTLKDCHACRAVNHFDAGGKLSAEDQIVIHEPPPGGIKPERIWQVRLPRESFQGSLVHYHGRYLLAYRAGWIGANVGMADLGANPFGNEQEIIPVDRWELSLPHKRATHGREDPRMFLFRGRLHVSFNGLTEPAEGLKSDMLMARLTPDGRAVDEVWTPSYDRSKWVEKNWQYFEHAGSLYAIYQSEPHTILKIDGSTATEMYRTLTPLAWEWGNVRGGSPPVQVGNEYYHFFHGRKVNEDQSLVYTLGVYTFQAQPPFAITRFASIPLLVPPPGETSPRYDLTVVFPCGAVLEQGKWLVSYGHNDLECRVARFDFQDVESLLQEVRSKEEKVSFAAPHGYSGAIDLEAAKKETRGNNHESQSANLQIREKSLDPQPGPKPVNPVVEAIRKSKKGKR